MHTQFCCGQRQGLLCGERWDRWIALLKEQTFVIQKAESVNDDDDDDEEEEEEEEERLPFCLRTQKNDEAKAIYK